MLCLLLQQKISYSFACLELLELCFLFLALLANGFARQVTHLENSSHRRKYMEPWEKDDLQSLFDIIYYFNHTQLQTEITSQHQTEAQIIF